MVTQHRRDYIAVARREGNIGPRNVAALLAQPLGVDAYLMRVDFVVKNARHETFGQREAVRLVPKCERSGFANR